MSESTDKSSEDEPSGYGKTLQAGKEVVSKNWHRIGSSTQQMLVASGRWTERGQVQSDASERSWEFDEKIESLEYALGIISHCVDAELPYLRDDPKALVPGVALTDDVLHQCIAIAAEPSWHEPIFLRLALRAVCQHEMANLLTQLPVNRTKKDPPFADLLAFLKVATIFTGVGISVVLALLSPVILAFALVQVNQGGIAEAAIAFYGLGLLWWLHWYGKLKVSGSDLSAQEKTYRAWRALCQFPFRNHALGEGALVHLKKMKHDGFDVPHVAFDVCSALRASVLWRRADRA